MNENKDKYKCIQLMHTNTLWGSMVEAKLSTRTTVRRKKSEPDPHDLGWLKTLYGLSWLLSSEFTMKWLHYFCSPSWGENAQNSGICSSSFKLGEIRAMKKSAPPPLFFFFSNLWIKQKYDFFRKKYPGNSLLPRPGFSCPLTWKHPETE